MKKFVIALMVTATSAIVLAQPPEAVGFHRHGHRGGLENFAATLNLTDAQKQQMNDIRTADRASNQQLFNDYHAKVQQFRALKQANDPSAADVKAQIHAMRSQIQSARKASHAAMLAVLTPDQQDQLKTAKQSHGFGRAQSRAFRGQTRAFRGLASQGLNLTDAQKTQLHQLREGMQQQNQQLFADAKAKRQELHSLRRANDPRASEVKAQLEALRPQLDAAREQQHAAYLNILTPEQRTQLEQLKSQRQQKLR